MDGDGIPRGNQLLTEDEAKAMRNSVRKRVIWKARIKIAEAIHPCAVADISLGGVRLHLVESVETGTKVKLILDRFGAFNAEVIWCRDGGIGLRFTDDPRRIAGLIGARIPLEHAKPAGSA